MLRITFQTDPGGPLQRLHGAMPSGVLAVDGLLQVDTSHWLAYLTVGDLNRRPENVGRLEDVDLVYAEPFSPDLETYYLMVRIEDEDDCIVQSLARRRAVPHSIELRDQRLEGVVTVENWDHLRDVANEIEDTHDAFELLSVSQVEEMGALLGTGFKQTLQESLSEKQYRTLEVAYRSGYFKVPQQATADDVAARLDISQSTFSERLRRSMDSVFAALFGRMDEAYRDTSRR